MCTIRAQSGSRKQNLLGGPDVGSGREENKSGGREEGLEREIYMENNNLSLSLSLSLYIYMCV